VRRATAAAITTLLVACLGPQVSDEVGGGELILPAGSTVPRIEDDPALAAQIDDHDGVGATIPRYTAFAAGEVTHYWDLGPAPDFVAPVYVLHRRSGDTLEQLAHPPIFDAIPGDAGYSPYWLMYAVEVADSYAGEIIPSVAALNQAHDTGLVVDQRSMEGNINCPVILDSVTVDDGGDASSAPRRGTFYYRGRAGTYLDFGVTELAADRVTVPATPLYVLRREGGEPLSEPARGVDMTGDGDLRDTNNVFALPRSDAAWSPLCREIGVTVLASTQSIDSSRDEAVADVRAAVQLFGSGGAPTSLVVALAPETRRFNCPQRGN
jgi:hypothetical protein